MKKYVLWIIILAFCSIGFADKVEVAQPTPFLVASDSNAAALDTNCPWGTAATWSEIPSGATHLKIKFYVYDTIGANDSNFLYQLYVADYGSGAEKVCSGLATCGAAQLSHNPVSLAALTLTDANTCWVDTLGTVTTDWNVGSQTAGVTTQNDGGSDGIASLIFNRQSAKRIWCRMYTPSTTTMTMYCIAYWY